MPNTDFFDDDLAAHRNGAREEASESGSRPGGEREAQAPEPETRTAPSRAVSDLNLSRMTLQKKEVGGQVARAAEELELLRQRQQQLEREKRVLEELRHRQDDYEQGKREMTDHLNRTLLVLEKDEVRTGQMLDLLGATRTRFRAMMEELNTIDEESWEEQRFNEELGKALARIEDMRMEYKKTMARIQAVGEQEPARNISDQTPVFDGDNELPAAGLGFVWWLKAGLAFGVPFFVLGLVFLFVIMALRNFGMM